MEPGGAPSELSFGISCCRSSFGHRAPGKGPRCKAFTALLVADTARLASNVPNWFGVDALIAKFGEGTCEVARPAWRTGYCGAWPRRESKPLSSSSDAN